MSWQGYLGLGTDQPGSLKTAYQRCSGGLSSAILIYLTWVSPHIHTLTCRQITWITGWFRQLNLNIDYTFLKRRSESPGSYFITCKNKAQILKAYTQTFHNFLFAFFFAIQSIQFILISLQLLHNKESQRLTHSSIKLCKAASPSLYFLILIYIQNYKSNCAVVENPINPYYTQQQEPLLF